MDSWLDRLARRGAGWRERWLPGDQGSVWLVVIPLFLLVQAALGWYWSREPEPFQVVVAEPGASRPGVLLATTLARVVDTLTDKHGGYLHNDLLPPGVLLDDIPAWEIGVLHQARDLSRALHRDMGMSPARLVEDVDLAQAEAALNVSPDSWVFPAAEREFGKGGEALHRYARRLEAGKEAAFSVRQSHLLRWMADVDGRLALLTARLNAALPDHPVIVGAGGEMAESPRTPAWQVDNAFYEARGSAWALMHLLRAVEVEFAPVLEREGAQLSLRAAIHELEATQQTVWSPIILNGSGFGLFANHSLVMANYLGRARANLDEVRALLRESESRSVTEASAPSP